MYDIEWSKIVNEEWLKVPEVCAGRMQRRENTPELYALISEDTIPLLRVNLYADSDDTLVFNAFATWANTIALGWGNRIFFLQINTMAVREFSLGAYFGNLRLLQKELGLLVASAERLFLFQFNGTLVWRSNVLGIDGVIIDSVEGDIVTGEGEWDPPGGWKPFRVQLSSGMTV